MPRNLATLLTISLTLTVGAQALAAGDPTATSLAAVNKAVDAVRSDAAACKTVALKDLKDARDLLEAAKGKASVDTLTKARRKVEDVLDNSGDSCAATTQSALKAALKTLAEVLESTATAAAAPSPQEKKLGEMRQCWNFKNDWTAVDPACHTPRDGHFPMSKVEFNNLLSKLQRGDDRFDKTRILEDELGQRGKLWVSAAQLAALLRNLENDIDRAETVKVTISRLVDYANANTIAVTMSDMQARRDAQEAIQLAAEAIR